MNSWSSSLLVCYIFTSTSAVAASLAMPIAMTEACSRWPWNDTVCCTGGFSGQVLPGAENALSVAECDLNNSSSSVPGFNSISLVWDHPTFSTCPDRIFLFSHCINPANTLLDAPVSTLLYSSHGTHLASSTTISQPVSSACSYFGCFGCWGYQYSTFSEVSCTANSVLSSTSVQHMLLTVAPSSTSLHATQTQPNNIMVFPTETPPSIQQSSMQAVQSPNASSTQVTGLPTIVWQLLLVTGVIFFIVVGVLLILIVTGLCSNNRSRTTVRNMKGVLWQPNPWISDSVLNMYSPPISFKKIDSVSLHTLYEEMESAPTQKPRVAAIPSVDEANDSDCDTKCDSGSGTRAYNHGTNTCGNDNNSSSTCANHSGNTENEASSYITYGSLKNLVHDQPTT